MAPTAEQVNNKFLEVVLSRSGGGIVGLARNFRIIDQDRSGQLSINEFKVAMKKFRVGLTDEVSQPPNHRPRFFTCMDLLPHLFCSSLDSHCQ